MFKVGGSFIAVVLVALVIALIMSVNVVEAGYAGVVYNTNGGIEEKTLAQGWHIVAPWKKVIEYPVSTETVYLSKDKKEGSEQDESFSISTKDGKLVNVDSAYSFRISVDRLPYVFNKFRGQEIKFIINGYMRDRLKEACNEASTTFDVIEIYGEKRQELNNLVFKKFSGSLMPVGIILETFSFTRVEPDKESLKAIQAKVDAKQNLEKIKIESEKMKIEKEQAVINAEKQKVQAEGNAQARLIEAEGQAKANQKLQESLNEAVLRKMWIEKWSGSVPTVNGQGTNLMMEMPK